MTIVIVSAVEIDVNRLRQSFARLILCRQQSCHIFSSISVTCVGRVFVIIRLAVFDVRTIWKTYLSSARVKWASSGFSVASSISANVFLRNSVFLVRWVNLTAERAIGDIRYFEKYVGSQTFARSCLSFWAYTYMVFSGSCCQLSARLKVLIPNLACFFSWHDPANPASARVCFMLITVINLYFPNTCLSQLSSNVHFGITYSEAEFVVENTHFKICMHGEMFPHLSCRCWTFAPLPHRRLPSGALRGPDGKW